MAGVGAFRQYAVKIDATFLDEVLMASAEPNGNVEQLAPLGAIDVTANLLTGANPIISFSTLKLGTVFGAVGLDGLDVTTGLEASWIEKAQGGAFEAAGKKVTAAKCYLLPQSIRCEAEGHASIDYVGYCYSSDGATHPIATATTLPAGTPGLDEVFGLGEVKLATTALGLPQSVEFAIGNNVERIRASHLIYPTKAHLLERRAVMTIRVRDLGELSDARLVGSEVAVEVKFLKRSVTGGGWLGSGDKTLAIAKAYVIAQSTGPDGVTLQCSVRKDGVTAIFTIT